MGRSEQEDGPVLKEKGVVPRCQNNYTNNYYDNEREGNTMPVCNTRRRKGEEGNGGHWRWEKSTGKGVCVHFKTETQL